MTTHMVIVNLTIFLGIFIPFYFGYRVTNATWRTYKAWNESNNKQEHFYPVFLVVCFNFTQMLFWLGLSFVIMLASIAYHVAVIYESLPK